MSSKYEVTTQEITKHNKQVAVSTFITGGGAFTATVLYWLSQLDPQTKAAALEVMCNFLPLPH